MSYLPFLLLAFVLMIAGMQLSVYLGSRRQYGQKAPEYDELLDADQAQHDKLLFYFHSPRCPPCRALTPLIERMQEKHGNVVQVDVLKNPDAARGFSVRATPTMVLVKRGLIAKVMLGAVSERQLETLLR